MKLGDQYDLFGGDPPAQRHSETSLAAASQIKVKIGPLHRQMLRFLGIYLHGATDEEMQDHIPMGANTQRPRRRELQLMGYIVDSNRRKKTKAGLDAVIWILSPPERKE